MEKLNFKYIIKRISAYIIDIVVVMIISSLVASIPVLNKNNKEYQKVYQEFETIYNNYTKLIQNLNDYYKDNSISEEEYNELIQIETFKSIIEEKYSDNKITESEINTIKSKSEELYTEQASVYNYKLQKTNTTASFITIIITLLYFGVIEYLLKGQTIGKKVFNLKIVSIKNNKNPNILNYLLRSLIINNVFLNTIDVILLINLSKSTYQTSNNIISFIISLIEAITIYLVITREDRRGLHDLLLKTKVIESKEK